MKLVLALREELLEEVVSLMDMMTILSDGNSTPSRSRSSFSAQEWAPAGSEKCLKFLQAAVWVQGEFLNHVIVTCFSCVSHVTQILCHLIAKFSLTMLWQCIYAL